MQTVEDNQHIIKTINKSLKIIEINTDKRSQIYCELNKLLFQENSNLSKNNEIKKAWNTLKEYKLPDSDKLKILLSHPGHFINQGCNTGLLKNPHWLVEDLNKNQYYIMYVNNQTYTMFSKEDYQEIINPKKNFYCAWNFHQTIGYVATKTYPYKKIQCIIYILLYVLNIIKKKILLYQ